MVAGDPSDPNYRIPGLTFPGDVNTHRLRRRQALLDLLDRSAGAVPQDVRFDAMQAHYQKAWSLLATQEVLADNVEVGVREKMVNVGDPPSHRILDGNHGVTRLAGSHRMQYILKR